MIAFLTLTISSCSKEGDAFTDNRADKVLGTYSISVIEHVVWGNDSGTLTDTGTLTISKISETQVKARGFFNCVGEIANDAIYFKSIRPSDSAGYMTTSFGPATLSGNVLTMTATSTGQLGQNGKFYPFRSTQKKQQASGSILAGARYPYHSEPMSIRRSLCATI